MNTVNLHPEFKPHAPAQRMVGIGFVILLHLLLAYALVTGTARTALELVNKPLQAVLVEEITIAPPPPLYKEIVKTQIPKVEAPPPPFMPPPFVPPPFMPPPFVPPPDLPPSFAPPPDVPAPVAAPAIQSVATPPLAPALIAPPHTAPVAGKVAGNAPPAPSGPVNIDIKIACPTQTRPEMPRKAIQDNASGVVKAQVLIRNGAVAEVTILSGSQVFHQAVRNALAQYKCQTNPVDVQTTQEFAFKIEE